MITILIALVTGSFAAAECPWEGDIDAYATMTTVGVNGQTYMIRGPANWKAFDAKLKACAFEDASKQLRKWRTARQFTNASAVVGLVVFWPVILATPVDAVIAGAHKNNMVAALRERR